MLFIVSLSFIKARNKISIQLSTTAKPKEKLYRLNEFNGLYLEVKPNGKKAWRYR